MRLPIPELNEERRRELSKLAAQFAEQSRVAVRNVRKDGMDKIKKLKLDGMSEDDEKFWADEVQNLTDLFINEIDEFELTVLYQLVNISSSLILSYLLFNKIISSEVFLSLSFLEENFQEAKWGLDNDSIKKKSAISKDLSEVIHFLDLLD